MSEPCREGYGSFPARSRVLLQQLPRLSGYPSFFKADTESRQHAAKQDNTGMSMGIGRAHALPAFGRSQISAVIFKPWCPVSAPKRQFKSQRSKISATSKPASHASSTVGNVQVSQVATLSQYDDCELLWLQYGRQLSLSKSAIYWSLQVRGIW